MEREKESGGITLAKVSRGQLLQAMETAMRAIPNGKQLDERPLLGCVFVSIGLHPTKNKAVLTISATDSVVMVRAQVESSIPLEHTAEFAVDARELFGFANSYHGEDSSEVEVAIYKDLSFEHHSHKVDGVEPDAENAYGASIAFRCGQDELAIADKYVEYPKTSTLVGKWLNNDKSLKACISVKALEKILLAVRDAGGDRVELGFVDGDHPFSFWAARFDERKNAEGIVAPLLSHH